MSARATAAVALAAAAFAPSCSSKGDASPPAPPPLACPGPEFAGSPLGVRCGALVDALGREVTLTGINARVDGVFDVTLDGGRTPLEPIPAFDASDARRMRELGFGALRLPIQWSGVEPTEAGGFDEAYLDRVATTIDAARAAGLLVLVDLHQDAYSKEIGEDGAPYWAIVPPPPAKLDGPLTNLTERRLSKPVADAFATFFGDSQDGARLRDRFAKMAAHVATRFAHDDAVVGFDVFNEPVAPFERLRAFHEQMVATLRAAAPDKLVFFEPGAQRNLLDSAEIATSPLGPGTVYAPHVYTFAFSTPDIQATVTRDAVERSYANARSETDAWQAPLVVGEYGFPPSAPNFAEYVRWHAELAEQYRASTFFWVWKEESQGSWGLYDVAPSGAATERASVVTALSRVRLEACAGRVREIAHPGGDPGHLVARFTGAETTRESLVSFGARFAPSKATCDGAAVAVTVTEPAVVVCGGPGEHVLEVVATPK